MTVTTSKTRRLTDAHAALVATDLVRRVGPVVSTGRFPVVASDRYGGRCLKDGCGQTIKPGDVIIAGSRTDPCGNVLQTGLWIHIHCPYLASTIDWLSEREYDFVDMMIHDCGAQNCERCGRRQESVTLYRVIDYPQPYTQYVCEGCVRL